MVSVFYSPPKVQTYWNVLLLSEVKAVSKPISLAFTHAAESLGVTQK